MPQRKNAISRPFLGALLLITITLVAPQVRAACSGPGGTWVYEVDVTSCEVPAEQLKEALEAEKATRPIFYPPLAIGQTDEQRKAAAAKTEESRQRSERNYEARDKRLLSTKALILRATTVRRKHYAKNPRLDLSATAEWEQVDNFPPSQILLRTDGWTQCSDLLKSRVVLLDTSPCCDLEPATGDGLRPPHEPGRARARSGGRIAAPFKGGQLASWPRE